ncbi:hypothetical protein [Myroides odoratimimus]|uniref:hypothetical protein n=2 Tax=Myroides odoratimimus TaxID=76832 RepID=UPI0025759680|nr:hypothetical protein [Myroides odoratimimus]MDM1535059.1 hypothetical protein [Myroides odoratimimus]MDM1674183.1 hypothetical protein [Myroides odoratimimus]
MYSDVMNKSLEANKRFVESMSNEELLDFMAEFDNYETIEPIFTPCDVKTNYGVYQNYKFYKDHELFKEFMKQRKSIDIKTDKKDPLNYGSFLFIFGVN